MSARRIPVVALTLLCAAALSTACAPASDRGPGGVRALKWPIVGGTLDTNAAHGAVVFIEGYDSSGEVSYACTGTLFSNNAVMTAGHCASVDEGQAAITDPTLFGVFFDENDDGTPDWPSKPLWFDPNGNPPGNVTAVHRHPNYNYNWDGQGAPVNDITVLLISAKPSNVTPIPYLTSSLAAGLTDGVSLEFVGYGDQSHPSSDGSCNGGQCPMGTRFHVTAPLTSSCVSSSGCSTSFGEIPPGTIYYTGSKGPCSGDSGGPAFLTVNGQQYIAGATSYGDSACETAGISTKVDYFASSFLAQYGSQGSANGATCSTGTACQSGFCVDGICCNTSCGTAPCSSCSTGTCKYTTVACDDGNACTTGDTCKSGACVGTAVNCSTDSCHDSATCNPSTGQCEGGTAKSDGSSCNDANACTTGDVCTSGVCAGTAKVCTPTQACQVATGCNSQTGACEFSTAADGASCDDGNACTDNDTCTSGVCAGTQKTCTTTDPCKRSVGCDWQSGECQFGAMPDSTFCDDGDACTTNDHCQGGTCTGTAVPSCTASSSTKSGCGCGAAGAADTVPALFGLLAWVAVARRRASRCSCQ